MSYEELGTQFDGEPIPAVEPEKPLEETPVEPVETETSTEVVEETEEVEEDRHKKKSGSQRAREKAIRLEVENEMLRKQLESRNLETIHANSDGRPTSDQFPDVDSYVEALVDWRENKRKAEDGHRQRVESWEQKAQAARKEIEDFDEVLESAPAPSPAVAQVLSDSPIGANLAYHLATHEEEYKRINRLSPVNAARELGILEAKLSAPKTEPKKTTKAPAPITPVVSSAPVTPRTMRYEEF